MAQSVAMAWQVMKSPLGWVTSTAHLPHAVRRGADGGAGEVIRPAPPTARAFPATASLAPGAAPQYAEPASVPGHMSGE